MLCFEVLFGKWCMLPSVLQDHGVLFVTDLYLYLLLL